MPPSAPFLEGIRWVYLARIARPDAGGEFLESATLTRQAVAAWLWRARNPSAAAPPPCVTAPYADVPVNSPFCGHITELTNDGVLRPFADGGFHPSTSISRQALARWLWRGDHPGAPDPGPCRTSPYWAWTAFGDVAVTNPSCTAIAWLAAEGIAFAFPDGGFHPTDPVTRAAGATWLWRHAGAPDTSPSIDLSVPPTATVETEYTWTPSAIGGIPPYQWSWSLDAATSNGLVLDPATGTISGFPIADTDFAFDLTVTDMHRFSSTVARSVAVDPAPLPTPCTHPFDRVSTAADDGEAWGDSLSVDISDDGRFVAFSADAANLVPGDANARTDVFVKDCATGAIERVSITDGDAELSGASKEAVISGNGRFVAFRTWAPELVPPDAISAAIVRDRTSGTTRLVSVLSDGTPAIGAWQLSVSDDGRFVAFSDLFGFGQGSLHIRDRWYGLTTSLPEVYGYWKTSPKISGDGRYLVYNEQYLDVGLAYPVGGVRHVKRYNRLNGNVATVSIRPTGYPRSGDSFEPDVSDDGRFIVYFTLDDYCTHGMCLSIRDTLAGTTTDLPLGWTSASGLAESYDPDLSGDGRRIAFTSTREDLVSADTNGRADVFVYDRDTSVLERAGDPHGVPEGTGDAGGPALADNGVLAFLSASPNLDSSDTNGVPDVFVSDPS